MLDVPSAVKEEIFACENLNFLLDKGLLFS